MGPWCDEVDAVLSVLPDTYSRFRAEWMISCRMKVFSCISEEISIQNPSPGKGSPRKEIENGAGQLWDILALHAMTCTILSLETVLETRDSETALFALFRSRHT